MFLAKSRRALLQALGRPRAQGFQHVLPGAFARHCLIGPAGAAQLQAPQNIFALLPAPKDYPHQSGSLTMVRLGVFGSCLFVRGPQKRGVLLVVL